MKFGLYSIFILLFLLSGCIGDDLIDDYVEPEIRITSRVDTLAVGDTFQMTAEFFNNVGQLTDSPVEWSSSDESVALVSEEGVLWGRMKGAATISASIDFENEMLTQSFDVVIDEETIESPGERSGTLQTTSSYNLEGDFTLVSTDTGLRLTFSENYFTDDVLPGLYVYLTNNPKTIADALVIQEVEVFKGEHSYDIPDVGINDYSHVLYFCKPFNVKVGDGEIK